MKINKEIRGAANEGVSRTVVRGRGGVKIRPEPETSPKAEIPER